MNDELVPLSRRNAAEVDRRRFIQLLGASFTAGCTLDPPRQIVPYGRRPADVMPGEPVFYATSMVIDGYATGLLVESREGRPVKIEGNPDHPASLGATSVHHQAAIRQLYDDDRLRRVRRGNEQVSWDELLARLRAPRNDRGAGLRILLPPVSSPLLLALIDRVRARAPLARVAFHAPLFTGHDTTGTALACGRALLPQLHLDRAQVVLSLDSDFLAGMPGSLKHARQWAQRRQGVEMSRLYQMESLLSCTGSLADHRLQRRSDEVPAVAWAVARRLEGLDLPASPALHGADRFIKAVARDLSARPRGTTLVVAGERQPPAVHALCLAMNEALGNLGATVTLIDPVVPVAAPWLDDLPALSRDLRAGRVDTLVMIDVNPVYDAPADLRFAEGLGRVAEAISIGYHEHETAERCRWSAPLAHFLESWGDARAHDGTFSLVQPLIRPLVDARSAVEVLAALADEPRSDPHLLLHDAWRAAGLDEEAWQALVRDGFRASDRSPVTAAVRPAAVREALGKLPPPTTGLAVEIHPSASVHDGRFANNPWLLELPEPLTKLTWDNAVLLSPNTARQLGVASEELVELAAGGASVTGPVLVTPGAADGVAAIWLGYGRRSQERFARGVGFDAYPFRSTAHPYLVPAARIAHRPGRRRLARTQEHQGLEGRAIALSTTAAAYQTNPRFTAEHKAAHDSVLPERPYPGLQWAMSIDLSLCMGCSACVVACQAENNLLVVGRDNVLRGRHMQWLRIDSYYRDGEGAPSVIHQPMLCQHCEKAPCEYVCPVNATVHSADGLNEMIYNRCIGTRFCSNNCPYKVRRFNWFDFREREPANQGSVELQYNPEVTVRERGVMEKCTYCVQRIRRTEIRARLEERPVRPGEVVTACQAACPTGAIQFGSLSHRDTPMVRMRQEDRSYAVLHELGTRPRTMYLARIDNPPPERK
jgi:Fe-S-cluster-containing dehydrogenase component